MSSESLKRERLEGLLLGTAVGDCLGLPVEGLSARRVFNRFQGHWQHHFFFGRGMWSDETEQTIFVSQTLLKERTSPHLFASHLANKLRWWLLGVPVAIGFATLKAILRLWMGYSPSKSGVGSAGNGAAMRSSIIGGFFATDTAQRRSFVEASTLITHTDPRALIGALAMAEMAAWSLRQEENARPDPKEIFEILESCPSQADPKWSAVIQHMRSALDLNLSTEELAIRLRLNHGISGYAYHSVPMAIYAWLRNFGDFQKTVSSALNCGGDTDTVGSMAGALAGASLGAKAIPTEWVDGIFEFPRTLGLLRELAICLSQAAEGKTVRPVGYFWPTLVVRNFLFSVLSIFHFIRRFTTSKS